MERFMLNYAPSLGGAHWLVGLVIGKN